MRRMISLALALCVLALYAPAMGAAEDARAACAAAGKDFTFVVRTDGSLWARGENLNGQLGDGSGVVWRDRDVQTMANVAFVVAGSEHSAAIQRDGTLWTWGANAAGQLGKGDEYPTSTPQQIMADVASVAVGYNHTLILRRDGSLYACGASVYGQLGLGEGCPVKVRTPKLVTTGMASIAAGSTSSCAIDRNGALWMWGNNGSAQLGDGTYTNRSLPVQVMTDVKAVAAGYSHTLALKTDGTLWSWGNNSYGQLGDGGVIKRNTPQQVLTGVKAVAAGKEHSLALKTDGTLWAWGSNVFAQVGNDKSGNDAYETLPVQVLSGVTDVWSGHSAKCSFARKADGSLWAWGSAHELGGGISKRWKVPTKVMDGERIPVNSIALSPASARLRAGETVTITATVLPANATDKTLSWASSDYSIATVSSSGTVTAFAPGSATITCAARDGSGKTAACQVTVVDATIPVSSVTLSTASVKLAVGKTKTLKATVLPANATDKTLSWKTSDKNVASVNASGQITAKRVGAATVTCAAKDGSGRKASCKVTVTSAAVKLSVTDKQGQAIKQLTMPAKGGSVIVYVRSNYVWQASPQRPWITLKPARGAANKRVALRVTVGKNTTSKARANRVNIVSGGKTYALTIQQKK